MDDVKLAIVASAVFHATLITVSIVGVPALMRPPPSQPEVIPIDIVDIDDVIRARKAAIKPPEEKPAPKPKPQEQRQAKVVEPAVTPDAVPMPEAKPRKKPKIEVRPKDRITASTAPRVKPRPPSRVDASRLSALIDRSVQEEEDARQRLIREEEERQKRIEEAVKNAQVSQLEALRATGTIGTVIKQKMRECWSVSGGGKDAAKYVFKIRMYLNLDGTLARSPILLNQGALDSSGDSFYKVSAEKALNAVRRCQPYLLPKDRYDQWRQLDLIFDPREMIGG